MKNREMSFTVTSPDNSPPILFFFNDFTVGYNTISFEVVMNEACTVYFALQNPQSPVITFDEIKKKKVQFDYFVGDVIFGEYINNSSDFTYAVALNELIPNTQLIRLLFELFIDIICKFLLKICQGIFIMMAYQ